MLYACFQSHAAALKTTSLIDEYIARAASSVAMDGETPEWGQDDPLMEKQHERGATCAHPAVDFCSAGCL